MRGEKTAFEEAVEGCAMTGLPVHPNIKRRYERLKEEREMAAMDAETKTEIPRLPTPERALELREALRRYVDSGERLARADSIREIQQTTLDMVQRWVEVQALTDRIKSECGIPDVRPVGERFTT